MHKIFRFNVDSSSKMAGITKLLGFKNNKSILEIKQYTVHSTEVIGQGAFGVLYKGTDSKKNPIVAKRIDEKRHQRILKLNLDKLLSLDHPNVIRILDVERIDNIFWMFMNYFELGDLNRLFRTTDLSVHTKLSIMVQIACGLEYLHNQNIAHRDLKPGNILVAQDSKTRNSPILAKLADFDVSKCFDSDADTSWMSSNVGTLAFKAPEFFQRLETGKIMYHKNVDIYACGLTFLAIMQTPTGKKMLIPRIETAQEDSERYAPSIGQLVAERIKYKSPNLEIVTTDESEDAKAETKMLIQKMTRIVPNERLSASESLRTLLQVGWKV